MTHLQTDNILRRGDHELMITACGSRVLMVPKMLKLHVSKYPWRVGCRRCRKTEAWRAALRKHGSLEPGTRTRKVSSKSTSPEYP